MVLSEKSCVILFQGENKRLTSGANDHDGFVTLPYTPEHTSNGNSFQKTTSKMFIGSLSMCAQ